MNETNCKQRVYSVHFMNKHNTKLGNIPGLWSQWQDMVMHEINLILIKIISFISFFNWSGYMKMPFQHYYERNRGFIPLFEFSRYVSN